MGLELHIRSSKCQNTVTDYKNNLPSSEHVFLSSLLLQHWLSSSEVVIRNESFQHKHNLLINSESGEITPINLHKIARYFGNLHFIDPTHCDCK